MRDIDFLRVFEELVPKLDQFFHQKIKNCSGNFDKAVTKEDLMQLTALEAFENFQKPETRVNYTIETLIWLKAKNVWFECENSSRSKAEFLPVAVLANYSDRESTFKHLEHSEKLGRLKKIIKPGTWQIITYRNEGFSFEEIETITGKSAESLRNKIHRLRNRLRKLRFE